jgi:hypothetical protein
MALFSKCLIPHFLGSRTKDHANNPQDEGRLSYNQALGPGLIPNQTWGLHRMAMFHGKVMMNQQLVGAEDVFGQFHGTFIGNQRLESARCFTFLYLFKP